MIIPPTWNLPETIRNRLGASTYGRQRAMLEDGHLLVILHKPPGPDDAKREGCFSGAVPAASGSAIAAAPAWAE